MSCIIRWILEGSLNQVGVPHLKEKTYICRLMSKDCTAAHFNRGSLFRLFVLYSHVGTQYIHLGRKAKLFKYISRSINVYSNPIKTEGFVRHRVKHQRSNMIGSDIHFC